MTPLLRRGLTAAAAVPQVLLLVLVGYNLATSVWGWTAPPPAPPGRRARRFLVAVPAHDEERVIGGVLADLAAQDYPPDHVDVWVVADRCSDGTVPIASAVANVAERSDGQPGKGPALAWLLEQRPLHPDEALVVLDADNRLPPDLLARIADELDAGAEVVQAYLDVLNPDGGALATASALTYWAGNRMIQLARSNRGWPADLGGTGMAFTAAALEQVGGFGGSVTEDQELTARLQLAGISPRWLHDVRVRDEKPSDLQVAVRQRARWMAGKRQVGREHVRPLLVDAVENRRLGSADLALRLVQPGRSFVALGTAVLAVLARLLGRPLLPWRVWGGAAAAQVLAPVAFLAREGVAARYLLRYPLVTIVAALWIPVRLLSGRVRGWYHTPHRGGS